MMATIAKTSKTKNTKKKLTDEERAELQEIRREAVENLARIDRLLGLPTA
jgi:hypothetical protein